MQYAFSEENGTTIVAFSGTLEFSNNEIFEKALEHLKAARPKKVAIDLRKVTGLDSVGLGLLYIAKEELDEIHCQLSLRGANGQVARLLNLSNARMSFTIE